MKKWIQKTIMLSILLTLAISFTANAKEMIVSTQSTGLNIRSGPDLSYDVIGSLPKGSIINVIDDTDGWSKIIFENAERYVKSEYLSEYDESKGLPNEGALVYLGKFRITHYCPCSKCCGKNAGHNTTYSGTVPTAGRTCAVKKSQIPLGSQVYVDGYGYRTAEDIGSGVYENCIDIFVDTHAEAEALGTIYKDVWVVK